MLALLKDRIRRHPKIKSFLKKAFRVDQRNQRLYEIEAKFYESSIPQVWSKSGLDGQTKQILKFLYPIHQESDPCPTLETPASQACTLSQFREPEFVRWCNLLSIQPTPHRKKWEYVFICRQLEKHGLLSAGKKGLGFGVGIEPMVPYFANQHIEATATDLDTETASEKGWVDTNQYSRDLNHFLIFPFANRENLHRYVRLQAVDMNRIPDSLKQEQFDFVWSSCALEHLGSIEQGLQFILNSLDCLKPGGIAVHTTELNLNSNEKTLESGSTVLFRRTDFEDLADRCRKRGIDLRLNFYIGEQPQDVFYDVPPYSDYFHAKLLLDNYVTTSYGLILQKGLRI